MNNINILWIDDHWSSAEPVALAYLEKLKNMIEHESHVKIITQSNIAEGIVEFAHNNKGIKYDLIIVDLKFDNAGVQYNFNQIIKTAEEKLTPYLIFSSHISDYIRNLPQDLNFLRLGCINKQDQALFIETVLNFAKIIPLKIIHLSDFHFDSSLKDKKYQEQIKRFSALINELVDENNKKAIDLIIFTGDFSFKNPEKDLNECRSILGQIVNSAINKNVSKLLIIPGNHDVQWDDFDKAIISKKPGELFYRFLEEVYNHDKDILSKLIGFNHHVSSFDEEFQLNSFSWSRKYTPMNVHILGLNSIITIPEKKGLGEIGLNAQAFVSKQWPSAKPANEIRIALFHHNILPTVSPNTLDGNDSLLNAGEIIELLSNSGCDILLSGHCHNSYVYNFSYSALHHNGFPDTKNLLYISTGTTGGHSPTGDRPKTFNIINIRATMKKNEKQIIVIPYQYDSTQNKWISGRNAISLIS